MPATRGVRIIGGRWRGRRLAVARHAGLRPSTDRARETLFNWLAPSIAGARCLDLFAGSGVLGLEALSRGAAEVVFVERAAGVLDALHESIRRLDASGAHVVRADAWRLIRADDTRVRGPFDVVFLDPPFGDRRAAEAPSRVLARGWLAPGAYVYVELPLEQAGAMPPAGFECWRSARTGHVWYALLRESRVEDAGGEAV